jgi:hypothetical protein
MVDEVMFQREKLRREMQECINDMDVATSIGDPETSDEVMIAMRVALMGPTAQAYVNAVAEKMSSLGKHHD